MEGDGLTVYGASLRCVAQLLVLELVKLVFTPRIKRRCNELQLEDLCWLKRLRAKFEQLANTYGILRYAAAILDLAAAQADAHVLPLESAPLAGWRTS
jgi:hypothetical protein